MWMILPTISTKMATAIIGQWFTTKTEGKVTKYE
jgi:hypothetical protein